MMNHKKNKTEEEEEEGKSILKVNCRNVLPIFAYERESTVHFGQ